MPSVVISKLAWTCGVRVSTESHLSPSDGLNSIFADIVETTEDPVDGFSYRLNHMLLAGGTLDLISISQHADF